MSSKGAAYKKVYHRYVIFPFINYVIQAKSQKMTEGWEGVWKKMTDDDNEAGGRREKALTAL